MPKARVKHKVRFNPEHDPILLMAMCFKVERSPKATHFVGCAYILFSLTPKSML